jgi:putative peptidoglycan lipid II flippase
LTSPSSAIARGAGAASAATLASRVLGLARDQVLAALFGAGNQMDAFIVAFRVPNLVRDLFAEGAMSAAFVPTFTRHLTLRGKADAWRVGSNVLNALLTVSAVLVVIGCVVAEPLVTLYAGDYGGVPGKLELTILLTRLMLPFLIFVAIAAALMGMLNSLQHYFIPALSPASFNVAVILSALLLTPVMSSLGWPAITAIAIGTLLGGAAQVAVQWPMLRREGFRYHAVLDPADPGLRRVLVLMGPGTVGLAATQLNVFVNTLLATSQGTGAASWLTYAFRVMYLPIGLFGVSIATAVLPAAARHAAHHDAAAIRTTVGRAVALMLMLNVPATFGLAVLADPIVRLLFERGRFVPADTAATAAALQLYAVGLVGYSTARIASPVFYALGQSRLPVGLSVAAMVVNAVASVVLVNQIGFRGLALGTSIAALTHGALALAALRWYLGGIEGHRLAITAVKVTSAALVMVVVALATERWMMGRAPGVDALTQSLRLAAAIGAGLTALVVSGKLLRISELDDGLAFVRERAQKLL